MSDEIRKSDLEIHLVKASGSALADIIVWVDKKEYKLKNGGTLRLKVSSGTHKISCKSSLRFIKTQSQLRVKVNDKCKVSIKFDSLTGKLKIKEGKFEPVNKLCLYCYKLSPIGMPFLCFYVFMSKLQWNSFVFYIFILFYLIIIVLSIVALCQIKKTDDENRKMATCSIIISSIFIIVCIYALYMVSEINTMLQDFK